MRGSGTEREPGSKQALATWLEEQCRDYCRENPCVEVQHIDALNFRIRVSPEDASKGPRYFAVKVSEQQ